MESVASLVSGKLHVECGNKSSIEEFILLGFLDHDLVLLLLIFLMIYLLTIVGNVTIIVLTRVDPHLQTPMYFFLGNLAFLEICYTSVTAPKMISGLTLSSTIISFEGCMVQLYAFLSLGCTEMLLLATMALDRFLAICHPLRYHSIMSRQVCGWMIIGSWVVAFVSTLAPASLIARLPYCCSRIIDHFFCDATPLLQLACADTFVNEMVDTISASAITLGSLAVILVSYINIVYTVMRIPSASSRWKTFSTCGSHLIVIFIFFGTVIFMYIGQGHLHSFSLNKGLALCYTMVSPLLNPLVYSLRNKEVKQALHRVMVNPVSQLFPLKYKT